MALQALVITPLNRDLLRQKIRYKLPQTTTVPEHYSPFQIPIESLQESGPKYKVLQS
jgi:hypothetical protein